MIRDDTTGGPPPPDGAPLPVDSRDSSTEQLIGFVQLLVFGLLWEPFRFRISVCDRGKNRADQIKQTIMVLLTVFYVKTVVMLLLLPASKYQIINIILSSDRFQSRDFDSREVVVTIEFDWCTRKNLYSTQSKYYNNKSSNHELVI